MDIFEVFKARGSCRAYSDKAVSRELIDKLLEAGCLAPSALNQQPWRFVVVEDREKIGEITAHALETRDWLAEESGQGWVAKYDASYIGNARALIIVGANPKKIGMGSFLGETEAHTKGASACIENILLAAAAEGLGSIWFTMYKGAELAKIVEMAEGFEVVGLLPIGYPEGEVSSPPRKDHRDLTSYI
ncbi:MAG: hypothetical protein C0609_12700 [Deltaproteobacteria bacterium]|nr:MAG: hypothetical protein C0609_12700 [Deltaproteobacteria bacterium]